MRMQEFTRIINGPLQTNGYRIAFQHADGKPDIYPEDDEPPIPTLLKAWELAGLFAHNTTGKYLYISVKENGWNGTLRTLNDIVFPNLSVT